MAHGGGHGIVPNGGEPMWLTPPQRDSQPEGERGGIAINTYVFQVL